jgi:uncharacterized protein YuzE
MKQRYLEVTFRRGKPFAAYLYLPRPTGVKVARTADAGSGVKIDFDGEGAPIGVELTAPSTITAAALNAILASFGVDALGPEDLAPLAAA